MRPKEDTKEGGQTNRMMSLLRERTSGLRGTIQSSYNDYNSVPGGSLAGLTKSPNRMAEPLAPVFGVQPGRKRQGLSLPVPVRPKNMGRKRNRIQFMHGVYNVAVNPMFLLGYVVH